MLSSGGEGMIVLLPCGSCAYIGVGEGKEGGGKIGWLNKLEKIPCLLLTQYSYYD